MLKIKKNQNESEWCLISFIIVCFMFNVGYSIFFKDKGVGWGLWVKKLCGHLPLPENIPGIALYKV